MTLTEETLQFIREHRKDNVRNLALQAHKYPTVDVPAAIIQIVGRQIAEEKIPAWAAREGILYPTHLSMEQCSSEVTANSCFRHALPKSRETQSLTNRYSSACSSSMPSMTFVCRVSPGLV